MSCSGSHIAIHVSNKSKDKHCTLIKKKNNVDQILYLHLSIFSQSFYSTGLLTGTIFLGIFMRGLAQIIILSHGPRCSNLFKSRRSAKSPDVSKWNLNTGKKTIVPTAHLFFQTITHSFVRRSAQKTCQFTLSSKHALIGTKSSGSAVGRGGPTLIPLKH